MTRDTCAQVDTPRYSARHLDQLITRDRENQLKKTRTSLQQELQRLVRERGAVSSAGIRHGTIYIARRKDEETMTDGASTIYEITPYIVDSVASTATVE